MAKSSARKKAPAKGQVGKIGEIRIEAGKKFSARSRLAVRGLNVRADPEKEKVSLTLDRELVLELKTRKSPLSSAVNELLYQALDQERLRQVVDEMESRAGKAPHEAYERVLKQWLNDDDR